MSDYMHVTQYADGLESASAEAMKEALGGFDYSFYFGDDISDRDYISTLEEYGLRAWNTNVELLDMRSAIAVLTFVVRADHFCEGSLRTSAENGYLPRVLRRIAELDGTWERPNLVPFYHEYDENGYLSNWYESQFTFANESFPTSEHWMMWQKAEVFGDYASAEAALSSTNPADAKGFGRKVSPYDDATWHAVSLPLMRIGLRQKFIQNERLMNRLLSTGSALLAEAAPYDRIWGVGLSDSDPRVFDPSEWRGENLLGRTLMDVRADLRAFCVAGTPSTWSRDDLVRSQVWDMSLLELARIPSTRPVALMYAAVVAQRVPSHFNGSRDVLRKVRSSIADIDESMRLNMGGGLPIAGWAELLDELAFQVRLGRV